GAVVLVIPRAAVEEDARGEVVAAALAQAAVHDVGIVPALVHQPADREVDAAALAVLRHLVGVVAAAVVEQPGAVPVADALGVDGAAVGVAAAVVVEQCDTAHGRAETAAPGVVAVVARAEVEEGAHAQYRGAERNVHVRAVVEVIAAQVAEVADAAIAERG